MKRTSPSVVKYRGFTLIELLVVMSIISLLVALLLPALASSREVAQSLTCATNLRGTTQSVDQYANDFKRFHPSLGQYSLGTMNLQPTGSLVEFWYSYLMLSSYIQTQGNNKIQIGGSTVAAVGPLNCPTLPYFSHIDQTLSTLGLGVNGSVATNFGLNWELYDAFNPITFPGIATNIQRQERPLLVDEATRRGPARIHMMSELPPAGTLTGFTSRWQQIASASNFNSVGFNHQRTPGSGDYWTRTQEGVANVAFYDGHVAAIKPPDVPKSNTSQNIPWRGGW